MRSNSSAVRAGAIIVLAVIGVAGVVVVKLSDSSPVVIAAVLTAFAAVLATLPPIIRALKGR